MNIVHGLISCDSHVQLDRDAFTSRMSAKKWGAAIPHIETTSDKAHMAVASDKSVERWMVNGKVVGNRGVVNCPTVMDDPTRRTFPQYWEEVPSIVYNPLHRLEALDRDGIDGEVLYPNDPVQSGTFFQGDADFELACVQTYNSALAEWAAVSNRYAPLAIIPYMSDIEVAVAEVTRAIGLGHRGIVMLAEPSQSLAGLKHFNDSHWYPLWQACEELGVPVHFHGSGGLKLGRMPWGGFSRNQKQALALASGMCNAAQYIANLILSGIPDRYPRLKFVSAETGIGWVNYLLESGDFVWERLHLWTEGVLTKPSELFHRQVFVDFWYEQFGILLRDRIGMDNIMWESDYPHSTSTYPESRDFAARSLAGLPQNERDQLAFGNAMRLYGF